MDKNRFEMVYSQGVVNSIEIWKDKETGAMYMFRVIGGVGCGLCPMIGPDGKPLVDPVKKEDDFFF
ncbi:DUF6440 family protein [Dubosiella newyorkensis]|uniref:DUF6440 family protein n=1 Tax=Dubosiella newyorkensis TaxID=1862672 RepID=UPI0023F226FC|nr:DUF6440 family protein [Dubosiella newyorkensis]